MSRTLRNLAGQIITRHTRLKRAAHAFRAAVWKLKLRHDPSATGSAVGLAVHHAYIENRPAAALAVLDALMASNPAFDIDDQRFRAVAMIYHLTGRYDAADAILSRIADGYEARAKVRQVDALGLRPFAAESFAYVGHLGLFDLFRKAELLGILPPARSLLFGPASAIVNSAYYDYWESDFPLLSHTDTVRALRAITEPTGLEYFAIRCTDGIRRNLAMLNAAFARHVQMRWEAEGRGPLLELRASDRERGYRLLREAGMPEGAWFVGLHVRESRGPMREGRNAEILTYQLAVEEIARRGGWVLRMGDASMTPMPAWPNTIDFTRDPRRTDWLDVFVWAEGRFLIATGSGPQVMPGTFGKPAVITNWGPMRMLIANQADILVPKTYRHDGEDRCLTLRERLGTRHGIQESVQALADDGVTVLDNTAEEIRDAVLDMIAQVEGTLDYSETERALLARFAETAAFGAVYPVRLSRAFLARHPDLV